MKRCAWATREPLLSYHDEEWGTPRHDERTLFEFLVLEGAQAGLSWETILRKRDAYRRAFAAFDPKKVARFGARDITRLMGATGGNTRTGDSSACRARLGFNLIGAIRPSTVQRKEGLMIAFFREEEGQGLVEYALIIAVIAIAVIVAMIFLRGQIQNIFSNIGNNLT